MKKRSNSIRKNPRKRPTAEPESDNLTVATPNSAHEQEADQTATRITESPPGQDLQPSKNSSALGGEMSRPDLHREGVAPWTANQIKAQQGKGEALPDQTRNEMEQGFAADFSKVRVHTDNKANDLNSDLNARAFTVGNDIWFGQNQFDPQSKKGKKLIAHELTHTLQQGGRPQAIQKDGPEGSETEAATEEKTVPGFSQERNTCVPASIVTALMVLDKQNADAGTPSTLLANALQLGIEYFETNDAAIVTRLSPYFTGEELTNAVQQSYLTLRAGKHLLDNGVALSEKDYKELAKAFYLMVYNHDAGSTNIWDAGLNSTETGKLQRILSISPTATEGGPPVKVSTTELEENFTNPLSAALEPGQVVQVITQVGEGTVPRPHSYIMGRLPDGKWYLNDQAYRPAKYIEAATKEELFAAVYTEIVDNNYWLLPFHSSTIQLISP